MIDRSKLLSDLQKLLARLELDLLERSGSADVPDVGMALRAEHDRAKSAERTAQNYEDWRSDAITQAAVAWVLSCVFVRFLEDNRLIDPPKIAGPGERLHRARDEWELYLGQAAEPNERDYLLTIFDELARLPGTTDLFGEHNPIRELPNWLSGDGAKLLLDFFQKIDANTGTLIHDFQSSRHAPRDDSRMSRDSERGTTSGGSHAIGLPHVEREGYFEDTRFLGDLYQDLSEAARKKYALLQTPEFVEEFILERTLEPALDEFGLVVTASASDPQPSTLDPQPFKMIDPACGSGHFLLGSFRRILERWQRREPGTNVRELVQRTLDSVHGVDVNPFAIAIARFRLLLAAMRACGIERLADAPAFRLNLVCGDSLLHAPLSGGQQVLEFELAEDSDECDHAYRSENLPELKRLLRGGQYHAVVANPPYIVPKDRQLNERYRRRFLSCHRQYSLAVPFMERIFRLAITSGFTGQITGNSFINAEFGKKLITDFFPRVDLTHVVDASGARLPGHGTPTVIVFGRNRPPLAGTVRCVMGIRGDHDPAVAPRDNKAWRSITSLIDTPGAGNEFVSVDDVERARFHRHPWTIGGGGAADLKEYLDQLSTRRLGDEATSIGFYQDTHADDFFVQPTGFARRRGLRGDYRPFIRGEDIRDWVCAPSDEVIFFPFDNDLTQWRAVPNEGRYSILHAFRTLLWNRSTFGGGTYQSSGRPWFDYHQFPRDRARDPLAIAYAFVGTHNHYIVNTTNGVFGRTSPLIKLRSTSIEFHEGLTGVLNSSLACFWLKQVCYPKGGDQVGQDGARVRRTMWDVFYNFNATPLLRLPLPPLFPNEVTQSLVALSRERSATSIKHCLECDAFDVSKIREVRPRLLALLMQMVSFQEELDWECYRLYGLIADDLTLREPPPLQLGQRAFEIVLARKMAAGETQTTWFERHGSTPITELPAEWPDDYRQLVERRIALIESDPNIRLIEQPEYKRRWNTEPWDSQLERALREGLLDRLESYFDFDGRMRREGEAPAEPLSATDTGRATDGSAGASPSHASPSRSSPLADIALVSVAKLADVARQDSEFQQVGELFRDDPAFDVQKLVEELVAAECVPLLPVLRYKPSGLIKRGVWERTWDLQRQEDAIDARTKLPSADPQHLSADAARDLKQQQVGNIPVPTKYDSKDFLDSNLWRLRGKLDVPKERWISFPHCAGPDNTLVIAWAGYDHLQQAKAISAYYVDIQERLGGRDDPRLPPLLAGLIELLPWLKQWHNHIDPHFGMAMGDYFEGFVNEEAKQLGQTLDQLKAWVPPAKAKGRKKKT